MKMPAGAVKKPWGWYAEVYRSRETRLVRAHADSGGESSVHLHVNQHNIFVVLSGMLNVDVVVDGGPLDGTVQTHVLTSGSAPMLVEAGVKHRFVAMSDVEMFEQYLAVDGITPQESDIVRFHGHFGDKAVVK